MKKTFSVIALTVLVTASCSDFATAPDRQPTTLQVAPDTVVVMAGDTVPFDFTVLDQDGEPFPSIPSWAVPLWSYSTPSVLDVDGVGVGRTAEPGEVEAVAELAGLEATSVVRVNPHELDVTVGFVHVTQSVQRRAGDVPLVADRDGLLRVYLMGDGPNFFDPAVRATFYRGGEVVYADTLMSEDISLPEEIEEGELTLSYDAMIPGSVIQPGTSLVVEADPAGVVPATSSSELRAPATGQLALDVVEVPPFRMRLVPVDQSATDLQSTFNETSAPPRLTLAEDIYPMAEFDVDVRARYTTAADLSTQAGWEDLLSDIAYLRLDDGSPRYYYGGFRIPPGTNYLGLGFVGYPAAIGSDIHPGTIAHELGHNLNLPHAPGCGAGDPDPRYPYANGVVGQYGYDRTHDAMRDRDDTYDLMTYCDRIWISDYNYERVLAHRDTSSVDSAFAAGAAASRAPERDVLIVSAGVHDGALRIGPVLESQAPPSLPEREGRYTLQGLDDDGATVFRVAFEPRPLDHGRGALFAAAIPVEPADADRLATLRLEGPEGVAERGRRAVAPPGPGQVQADGGRGAPAAVRWDARAYPLAVARDRTTGRIVAMSRTGRLPLPGDPAGYDVVVSDGVRTHPVTVERR